MLDYARIFVKGGRTRRPLTDLFAPPLPPPRATCPPVRRQLPEAPPIDILQSVLSSDGTAMDVDVVINEVLDSGDEVFVEYGSGPCQYRQVPSTMPPLFARN